MADNIKKKRADYNALRAELIKGTKEMEAGPLSTERGAELEQKAKEAEALQSELGLYGRMTAVVEEGDEVDGDINSPEGGRGRKQHYRRTRKGMSVGEYFVRGKSFQEWKKTSRKSWSDDVRIPALDGSMLELSPEEQKDYDANDTPLPDMGTPTILQPFRDPDMVRSTERTVLRMRDVIRVVPTNSPNIEWVRQITNEDIAAAIVDPTTDKPYTDIGFALATTAVKTIAVLQKVTEQQLEDAPQLTAIINDEMSFEVRQQEERQIAWGSGVGTNLSGIFKAGNSMQLDAARYNIDPGAGAVHTHLDLIRKMITDITIRNLNPNALLIHPIDWEGIELLKGTDSRYLWAIIQTTLGPRVWGLSVVETVAMLNPAGTDRRFAVGDFIRGATLYDKHDVRLAIGLVDDDFKKNLKTIRVEERVGLAVKRTGAIEWYQTLPAEVAPSP